MSIRQVIPFAFFAAQSDIDGGGANSLPAGSAIYVVDTSGVPTGTTYTVPAGGGAPVASISSIKNNLAATVAPTVSDDSGDGYSIGSRWIDTVGDESYICLDAAAGTAIWSRTTVGTITEVANLQNTLDGKSATTHVHAGTYEPSNSNIQTHVTAAHAPSAAEQNVNADWSAASGDAQILNKPTVPALEGTAVPVMDGAAAAGAAATASKSDHVHPSDTGKQATLVSGTNIKTLNSQSVLGAGNIAVGASSASVTNNGLGTGGTVTDVVGSGTVAKVHTFTANGSFVVPTGVTAVRVLAVGGGGGGGVGRYRGDTSGRPGGGGGAGGYIHNTAFAVTPGAAIAVTIGVGGAGATDADDTESGTGGGVGGDTIFGTLTAKGGGGGGGHHQTTNNPWDVPADQGGSGGGGSNGSSGATQSAAAVTAGNTGNSGGSGTAGGGAGGAGGGGAGVTGVSGSGGPAQGGAGGTAPANRGGGGGGSDEGGSDGLATGQSPAGTGGSGVVIVRYLYQSLDTPIYANNAAAIAGGLTMGSLYRTGADPDTLCVVH